MTENEQGQSPLSEAEPNSIDSFFAKDPEEISDSEIEAMVKELRRQRLTWTAAEKNKVAKISLGSANLDEMLKDL